MDWYPRYPSLWRSKTRHLNPYQDGCYMRLVDEYMETRQPLPDNDLALSRIIGISIDEWIANASVIVRAFFDKKDGLLYHSRCDKILNQQDERSAKQSEKSKKGAEARWNKNKDIDATGIPQAIVRQCLIMPQDNTGQDKTEEKKEKEPPTPLAEISIPVWLPSEAWRDFVQHRKSIKKPLTEKAKALTIRELKKLYDQGYPPSEVINQSIISCWTGVFPLKEKTKRKSTGHVVL